MNSVVSSKSSDRLLPQLIGNSRAIRRLEQTILRAGGVDCPVLVTGETGSGKEEVARAIHSSGVRSERPFVAINCAGIVGTLAESQLFGHERGAFTGAEDAFLGAFRAASGGILFLDEIGELSLDLQPKILRALELREVLPIGTTRPVKVDVQVIAATNRDLPHEVAAGRFREDLLYRLNTIHITVPPLRARREDIPLFVTHFAGESAERLRKPGWMPPHDVMPRLLAHSWPGNVRELRQTILRIALFEDRLDEIFDDLAMDSSAGEAAVAQTRVPVEPPPETLNLGELRRDAVRRALAATGGHYGRAAALLGISAKTMTRLAAEACPGQEAKRGRRRRILPR